MKKINVFMAALLLSVIIVTPVFSASKKNTKLMAEKTVGRFVTTRYFTDEAVPDADIDKILTAGVNAESASNKQPWHFTAVTSKPVLKEILDTVNARRERNGQKLLAEPEKGKAVETNIAHVPLFIIVSCDKGAELNAGLATQSMAIMAQILGYGTKIESSPATAINEKAELSSKLGIPEGKKAVAVIKIGKADEKIIPDMDGYSSATVRNPFDQMTTKVK